MIALHLPWQYNMHTDVFKFSFTVKQDLSKTPQNGFLWLQASKFFWSLISIVSMKNTENNRKVSFQAVFYLILNTVIKLEKGWPLGTGSTGNIISKNKSLLLKDITVYLNIYIIRDDAVENTFFTSVYLQQRTQLNFVTVLSSPTYSTLVARAMS